jgi:hypothetical protein
MLSLLYMEPGVQLMAGKPAEDDVPRETFIKRRLFSKRLLLYVHHPEVLMKCVNVFFSNSSLNR